MWNVPRQQPTSPNNNPKRIPSKDAPKFVYFEFEPELILFSYDLDDDDSKSNKFKLSRNLDF